MPKDNRGVSLVELVVVIAVLAILSAATAMGLATVSAKPAEQCATEFKGAVDAHRTISLGKKDAVLTVIKKADGIHAIETYSLSTGTHSTDTVIAPNTVDIAYSTDGSSFTAVGDSGIVIEFDRSSGSLKNYTTDLYFSASKANKTYVVHIYQLTGKAVLVK